MGFLQNDLNHVNGSGKATTNGGFRFGFWCYLNQYLKRLGKISGYRTDCQWFLQDGHWRRSINCDLFNNLDFPNSVMLANK